MIYLKQSTAITLKIGPFLDETDGKTAETGLTIAQADVRLSKNGGDIAQKTEATSCTHDELGIYGCPIDATDTATLGRLQLFVHESGALPVFCEFLVVTANVYDTLCSTDKLEVDLIQMGGVVQSGTDLKDFADSGYNPSEHVARSNCTQWASSYVATPTVAGVPEVDITHIGGVAQSATDLKDLVDTGYDPGTHKIQGVVLADTCTTCTDMRGTDNAATEAKQDIIDTNVDQIEVAVITNAAGVDIAADIIAVKADTAAVLTDTGTTLDTLIKDIPTTAEFLARSDLAGTAATPAEVATALTDIHLDHLLAADYDPAAKPGVATALLNEIIESDAGISRYTANALEQAPSGSGATAAEVRIEMDANSTKLVSIETDTKGISDTAISADGSVVTTNSIADIARRMKWFVANLWEIDENVTPDTFKIFKDDNLAVGLNFTVYTDSSKSYRDNTP